jgi:hypothetical protein
MTTFAFDTTTVPFFFACETPLEVEEREAAIAGLPFHDDAVSAWAEQVALDEWIDDEQRRCECEMERDMMERGIF